MNKLKISTRLILGFSTLLLLVVALTGVGLWTLDTATQGTINETARLLFIGLAVATVLIGSFMTISITRSVVRPLNNSIALAQTIATQDLTVQIDAHGHDETGMLLRALQQMTNTLRSVVGDVHHSAQEITSASRQILAGNADLSHRTEDQASSLTQTAAAMEQLTATVRQNADNAVQANTLAMTAAEVATRGGEIVSQVVTTMESINTSSKKVEDIIGVIDSIAFQTNILALNAAVESARAGEAGRGFAVVASEVRSLAQRSAQAAREIKELITASVDAAATGNRLVGETGTTMTEIVESIQRVTDIMGEITAASQEQTSGIEQVNDAVHQMDQSTRQNAVLVQEAEAAANSLQAQADHLSRLVRTFKIQGRTKAPSKSPQPTIAASTSTVHEPLAAPHRTRHDNANKPEHVAASTRSRAAALPGPGTIPKRQTPASHNVPAARSVAPQPSEPLRTTASGVTVGAFQTSAGAVEEWEEF